MRKLALPFLIALVALLAWILTRETETDLNPAPDLPVQLAPDLSGAGVQIEAPTIVRSKTNTEVFNNRKEKVGPGNHQLGGQVVDENEDPVPGAWVAAYSVPFPLFDFEKEITEIFDKPLDLNLEPIASVFANEEGYFALEGLHGRKLYITARTHQRLSPRRQLVPAGALDKEETVLIRTIPAASLEGSVFDANGAPVPGAEVLIGPGIKYLLAAFRNRSFFMEKAITDASGHFQVEAIPARTALTLNAYRGGVEAGMSELGPIPAQANATKSIGMFPLGSLSGEVWDTQDNAVNGCDVVALPLDLRLLIPFIRDPNAWISVARANGRYSFEKLPHALYLLIAQGRDGRSSPATTRVSGADSQAPRLILQNKNVIKGRVVNGNGKAVPNAIVRLQSIPLKDDENSSEKWNQPGGLFLEAAREILPLLLPGSAYAITDGGGHFRIPAWASAQLRVEAQGYEDYDFSLSKLKDENTPVLQIWKPGSVEGTLVNQTNEKSIAMGIVRMGTLAEELEISKSVRFEDITEKDLAYELDGEEDSPLHNQTKVLPGWLEEGEQLLSPKRSWRAQAMQMAWVDNPKGSFRIDGVRPGNWSLKGQAEGFRTKEKKGINILEGETTKGIVIKLDPGAIVRGQVVDAGNRQPIGGAVVSVSRREDSGAMALLQGMGDQLAISETGPNGHFEVRGASTKDAFVHVLADGYAAMSQPIPPLEEAEVREGVRVEVPRGGTLFGLVSDRHGTPLSNRMVGALSIQAKDFHQTAADEEGNYRIENMRPGSYFLMTADLNDESLFSGDIAKLLSAGRIETGVVKEEGETQIDLVDPSAGGCRLEGILVNQGEPCPGANIILVSISGANGLSFGMNMARTDENGEFLFPSVAPGDYRAQIHAPTANWDGSLDLEVMDAAEDYAFLEVPVGLVRGRIISDETGEPQANMSLQLSRMDGSGGGFGAIFGGGANFSGWESTNEDGTFVFENISPGRYKIKVGGRSWGSEKSPLVQSIDTDPFRLQENDDRDLGDIRLPISGGIRVLVVSDSGEFNSWLTAKAIHEESKKEEDAWGRSTVEISGLNPGLHTVQISSRGWATTKLTGVQVRLGEYTEVTANMAKGSKLSLAIYGSSGEIVNADLIKIFDSNGELVKEEKNRVPSAMRNLVPGEVKSVGSFVPGNYMIQVEVGSEERRVPVVIYSDQAETVTVQF